MDPNSRAILMSGGGGPSGPEYIGTYRFTVPRRHTENQWQVPAQTKYIQAVAWGSGAKGKEGNNAGSGFLCTVFGKCGGHGGGGGFSTAVIPVIAGEMLDIGVGTHGEAYYGQTIFNGGQEKGGGFTSVFRGSTPLIIAGGGGGTDGDSSTYHGGGGGGDPLIQGPNNLSGTIVHGSNLQGATPNGGGGYLGGASTLSQGQSLGGTGYVTATGNLHTQTISADYYTPPQTTHLDYLFGYGSGEKNNLSYGWTNLGWGSGLLIIHCLGGGYDPASNPSTVIPSTRTILGSY